MELDRLAHRPAAQKPIEEHMTKTIVVTGTPTGTGRATVNTLRVNEAADALDLDCGKAVKAVKARTKKTDLRHAGAHA